VAARRPFVSQAKFEWSACDGARSPIKVKADAVLGEAARPLLSCDPAERFSDVVGGEGEVGLGLDSGPDDV